MLLLRAALLALQSFELIQFPEERSQLRGQANRAHARGSIATNLLERRAAVPPAPAGHEAALCALKDFGKRLVRNAEHRDFDLSYVFQ